jgi:hypothetical protein
MSDSCSEQRALEKTYPAILSDLPRKENAADAISQRRKGWTELSGEL